MTYRPIEEMANRKLEIISKDKNLTEEQKEEYLEIFIDDIIGNLAYTNCLINQLRGAIYEKVS